MSEKIVHYRFQGEEPGRLVGDASIIIHTRHASTLVNGRKLTLSKKKSEKTERFAAKNPRIPGLIDFGRQIHVVSMAAGTDDPLADWMLIRVEEAIERARGTIEQRMAQVVKALNQRPSVSVTVAESAEPVKVRLAFSTPYAYQAAYLIGDYDKLCMMALTATHVALLRRDDASQIIESCASLLRGVLSLPFNYTFRLLTRTDVLQNNQRAIAAMGALAEVPPDVLSGERRAMGAPEIKVKGSKFVEDGGQKTAAAIMLPEDELPSLGTVSDAVGGAVDGELEQGESDNVVKVMVRPSRRQVDKPTPRQVDKRTQDASL